jgi:RNA polymerase sigma-70 factor (ECF subfamily)
LEWDEFNKAGLLADEGVQAFEKVFTDWFGHLYAYAMSVVKDEGIAEEAVQAVFCRIWEKRERLQVHASLKAYLYGSVYHECMDWLRHRKRVEAHRRHAQAVHTGGRVMMESASAKVELGELEKKLQLAINELPDQCRAIFCLSRYGELGYKEIAGQLGISVKTVEAQISKALKRLRKRLADFLV